MAQYMSNEERESSIVLYPLSHICIASHTDEQDSTTHAFMILWILKTEGPLVGGKKGKDRIQTNVDL